MESTNHRRECCLSLFLKRCCQDLQERGYAIACGGVFAYVLATYRADLTVAVALYFVSLFQLLARGFQRGMKLPQQAAPPNWNVIPQAN